MKRVVLFFLVSLPFFNYCQNFGASNIGMGETIFGSKDVTSSIASNHGLAHLNKKAISSTIYAPFGLAQLAQKTLQFTNGIDSTSGYALSLSQNGNLAQLTSNGIKLTYGKALLSNFDLGLSIEYLNNQIPELSRQSTLASSLSFKASLNESFSLHNLVYFTSNGRNTLFIHQKNFLLSGISYHSEIANGAIEIILGQQQDPIIRMGLEYRPSEYFVARAGYSNTGKASFGIGYEINSFNLDLAVSEHLALGLSTAGTFTYVF